MNFNNINNLSISDFLKKLLSNNYSRQARSCKSLTDFKFIFTCVQRVIQKHSSGREFIQALEEVTIFPF